MRLAQIFKSRFRDNMAAFLRIIWHFLPPFEIGFASVRSKGIESYIDIARELCILNP